jgi:hypothetical protein
VKLAFIIVGCIFAAVVLFAVVAVLIGSRMPDTHTVSRSLRVSKLPPDVYGVIRNFGDASKWRSDVKRVEILGPDKFREHGSNGSVTYQIVEDVPNRRIVTQIMDLDLGYAGSWEYALEDSGDGTVVTITERGVVSNPLFRFMSRYIFGHTATIDAYLKSLDARL